MATISYNPRQANNKTNQATKHGLILDEEIEGLIRVYKDGYIERPQIIPIVNSSIKQDLGVTARDVEATSGSIDQKWWLSCCNFSNVFLAGDSAGANIAYNVSIKLQDSNFLRPLQIKGLILIQPFFGGESRTSSEKHANQPINSALTLQASDTYWRLALPFGASRDHLLCNPLANSGLRQVKLPTTMVCVSEMDILKDRNLEFCSALAKGGKKVETFVYKGVGHAFQILYNYPYSQLRVQELLNNIKGFINQ
ncbi:hypothetical protein ACFE04_007435 [Oxalis oulophora]